MVKGPLAATHLLPLAGTNAQVPMIVPPVNTLLFSSKVPVIDELVSLTVSPAEDVIVNANVPVTAPAVLNVRLRVPSSETFASPKQVSVFSSSKFERVRAPLPPTVNCWEGAAPRNAECQQQQNYNFLHELSLSPGMKNKMQHKILSQDYRDAP
jgi:hypothetical protein